MPLGRWVVWFLFNKQDEAKFIATAIEEIRQEIKSKDMELKAAAALKLTYVRRHSVCFTAVHMLMTVLYVARHAWL